MKNLVVMALSLIFTLIVGILISFLEIKTGFALYSFTLLFVIPIGALIVGFASTYGYTFLAKKLDVKPTGATLLFLLITSILMFLIVNYIPYFFMESEGTRIKDSVAFLPYMDYMIKHTSISFKSHISTGELGAFWGYTYTVIQFIGFILGGLFSYLVLLAKPYCESCKKYLKETETIKRYPGNPDELDESIKTFSSLLDEKEYQNAKEYFLDKMGRKTREDSNLKLELKISYCPNCNLKHFDFTVSKFEEKEWKEIDSANISVYGNCEL